MYVSYGDFGVFTAVELINYPYLVLESRLIQSHKMVQYLSFL